MQKTSNEIDLLVFERETEVIQIFMNTARHEDDKDGEELGNWEKLCINRRECLVASRITSPRQTPS